MRPKIDTEKLKHLPTVEELFKENYGPKGLLRVMSSMRVSCLVLCRGIEKMNQCCHSAV